MKKKLFVVSVLLCLGFILSGCLPQKQTTEILKPTPDTSLAPESPSTLVPSPVSQQNSQSTQKWSWKTHTSDLSGFSIRVPSHLKVPNGSETDNIAPTVTLEQDTTTLISSSYFIDRATNQKVLVTEDHINVEDEDNLMAWNIQVRPITTKNQVLTEAKSYFQVDRCYFSRQENQEVAVCDLPYAATIKFDLAKGKVAFWKLGQACSFYTPDDECQDGEMMESFKFN